MTRRLLAGCGDHRDPGEVRQAAHRLLISPGRGLRACSRGHRLTAGTLVLLLATALAGSVPAAPPRVVVTALTFSPGPPPTGECSALVFNQIDPDGGVAAVAVGEADTLRLTARAEDDDGDPVRMVVGPETLAAPGFVSPPVFSPDSTLVTLTLAPPWGLVQVDPCEAHGTLALTARERTAAADSQRVTIPYFAVWEGPDFAVTIRWVGDQLPAQ